MNLELVHSLRATDSAFSSGDSAIDVSCVKFGMLADEKDLDDLIAMVAERGRTIEDSAQVPYFWKALDRTYKVLLQILPIRRVGSRGDGA